MHHHPGYFAHLHLLRLSSTVLVVCVCCRRIVTGCPTQGGRDLGGGGARGAGGGLDARPCPASAARLVGGQLSPTVATRSPNAAIRRRPNGQGVDAVAPCAGRAPATRSLHLPLEAPAAPPDPLPAAAPPPAAPRYVQPRVNALAAVSRPPRFPVLPRHGWPARAAADARSRQLPDSAVPPRPSWLGLLVDEPRLHGRAGPQGAPQADVERTGFAGA
jgi:hypothetical protein